MELEVIPKENHNVHKTGGHGNNTHGPESNEEEKYHGNNEDDLDYNETEEFVHKEHRWGKPWAWLAGKEELSF